MATTPHSGATKLKALPTWLNPDDAARLAAYELYDDIYWNAERTFELAWRGTNDNPLYLPTGRIICNTINRYVGKGWNWAVNPDFGSDTEKKTAALAFTQLFKRERMSSKFNANKLSGIRKGDWCWYITADPEKPEGSRISIQSLDPANYFPIRDADDPERIMGVDIVEKVVLNETEVIKRQRYLKTDHPEHPNSTNVPGGDISYQVDTFELDGWEGLEDAPTRVNEGWNEAPIILSGITTLPVYHIRNMEEPGEFWGSSELRGIERLFAGVNQTISDQELTLALQGLGMYVTDAGAPVNEEGEEMPWNLGPGEVVEVGTGKKFDRIRGIDNIDQSIKHLELLQDQAFRVSGASDVAQGQVDVKVAESGIALRLRMGPIIEAAELRDEPLIATMDQMLYDLQTMWLPVYERINLANVVVESTVGEKLPQDKAARFKMLMDGYNAIPPLWSGQYVRDQCRSMGYDIPMNMLQEIMDEQAAIMEFSDPYSGRVEEESVDDGL